MEKLVKADQVSSIGLRNFNETQIKIILENAEMKPVNLQVIIDFVLIGMRNFPTKEKVVCIRLVMMRYYMYAGSLNPNLTSKFL